RLRSQLVQLRLGQLLDDLNHRPVGDALAVGEAASPNDDRIPEGGEELGRQSGLAHSGRPQDREQMARALSDRALVGACEEIELIRATDHGRLEVTLEGTRLRTEGEQPM